MTHTLRIFHMDLVEIKGDQVQEPKSGGTIDLGDPAHRGVTETAAHFFAHAENRSHQSTQIIHS